ncbi:MAG: c-type cytochrome [Nitrospinota bacterium]|nr:c-type cytochrome [Nitrospinota bacterium]
MNSKIFSKILVGLIPVIGFVSWQASAQAFHPSVYTPRVPLEQLEDIQEIESPYETTPERTEAGREIYFGKGLCVTCHSKDGKGVRMPGHAPRNFTDAKWQDARTDGELMWVLKNGSPGTGMPQRVGKVITEEEGWNVIQFIRTFRAQ